MTELIKKLSTELDKETMLLSRKAGKLLLLGSQDSVFLKALAKKADTLGIDYELTQCPKGLYQGTIADMETVINHAAARLYTDTSMDIDNSFHPGMSAVAQAVLTLLLAADLVEGKEITIVGRGHAVQNLAQHLIDLNATVTVAHSKTKSLCKATENQDAVIYATPAITRDISYNTRDLVIDLGNAVPHPDRLSCSYMNRIGQLTTSILLNRFVRKGR